MREFKFRFWEESSKSMTYDYAMDYRIDGVIQKIIPAVFLDLISMQCTGVKDKYGEDIYEGDIVKVKAGKKDFVWPIHDEEKAIVKNNDIGEVFYGCGGFVVRFNKYKDKNIGYEMLQNFMSDIETSNRCERVCLIVVGNIYENPELIIE